MRAGSDRFPGIPGAKTLAQYDPLSFGGSVNVPVPRLPDPHGSLEVTSGLPAGNISMFDTRWDLITNDTLAMERLLHAEVGVEVGIG